LNSTTTVDVVSWKQGHSQDFTLGATEAERRRRENRGAEDVRDWAGAVPLPNRLGLGSVVSSCSGVRAEPRPPTHFWHIWGPQNTSGRENSVTLLNNVPGGRIDSRAQLTME